ncbi:TolC family protein [Tsuneonella mangrovi]|uniref:TolC family protein n=1 Tax=Tsuneonella mangrovi TaxID=1982042 RepID=UPI000BA1D58D|nr:TolC family protein [Tsuneonella mangrovi]
MRIAIVAAMLMLSGCATYVPVPLASDSNALEKPVASVLEQSASAVERPWLKPVSIDLSKPLGLDAIATLAVANNPDLAALRARRGVAQAQVFAAGLLPDPTFSIGASKVASGPDTMLDVSGALGFDLNALRTRAVRRQGAVAQGEQVRLDLAWAEWQTAGQAKIQAVRIEQLQQIVSLAKKSRDSARSLLDRNERASARGDIAGDRLQAARVAAFSADDTYNTAAQSLVTAQGDLRRLLGLRPDQPLALAPIPDIASPPPASALFGLAEKNRTDLAALREGYAAQEAAVHKAVLDQFPNLGLTLNSQRDSAGNLLLGPAVDFTLPLWNRNRGTIAVERATRAALKAEYQARLFQTRADIAAAEAGVRTALQRKADALAGIDRIEHFAAASRTAADRGDLSLEAAESAEQALRDRQIQLAQAQQDYDEQMIALELLTGTPREAWPQ